MTSALTPEQMAVLENDVIALGKQFPEGFRQTDCEKYLIDACTTTPKVTLAHVAQVLNTLIQKQRINTFRKDAIVVWKLVAEAEANKMSSLSPVERMVYSAVEKEGNKGVWIKDLRKRTNIMGQGVLEKLMKGLMARKLIKAERSIAGKNKKVYMLYHLKPSLEVTGGTWYLGHDMDTNFIGAVQHAVTIIVARYGPMCAQQVARQLRDARVTKVELGVADVKTILSTLVLEGKLSHTTPLAMPDALREDYLNRVRESENAREEAMVNSTNRSAEAAAAAAAAGAAGAYLAKRARPAPGAAVGAEEGGEDDDDDNDDDDDEDESASDALVYCVTPAPADGKFGFVKATTLSAPCIGCQIKDKCRPGGAVEPNACMYLRQWLADGF